MTCRASARRGLDERAKHPVSTRPSILQICQELHFRFASPIVVAGMSIKTYSRPKLCPLEATGRLRDHAVAARLEVIVGTSGVICVRGPNSAQRRLLDSSSLLYRTAPTFIYARRARPQIRLTPRARRGNFSADPHARLLCRDLQGGRRSSASQYKKTSYCSTFRCPFSLLSYQISGDAHRI